MCKILYIESVSYGIIDNNTQEITASKYWNGSVIVTMREKMIQKIMDEKVIAIVRGIYGEDCLNLAKALYQGGVKLMEVTFDQKSAEERQHTVDTIHMLTEKMGDVMGFGAGRLLGRG